MEIGELMASWSGGVVLLSVVVPLIGAAAVSLSARISFHAARSVALAGSTVSVVLAGCVLWQFDPEARDTDGVRMTTQMESGFVWDIGVSGSDPVAGVRNSPPGAELAKTNLGWAAGYRVSFGVDGLGLWPFVCVTVIVWCLIVVEWDRWLQRSPVVLPLLLLLEAALIGFLSGRDVLTVSICLLSVACLLPLLLGTAGGDRRRTAARRLMFQQWTAALLVTVGFAGLIGVHAIMLGAPNSAPGAPSFEIDQLIAAVPGANSPASAVWSRISSWLFLALMIGFYFWSGLAPSHSAAVLAQLEGDAPTQVALTSLSLSAGIYGLLRFVTPLFPQLSTTFGPALFFLAACSVIYTSAWMSAERDAARLAAGGAILWRSLALAGLATSTVNGIRGCLLLLPGAMLTSAACILAAHSGGPHGRSTVPGESTSADPVPVRLRPGGCFAGFAAAGLPGAALFPGILLVLGGITEMRWQLPGGWMLTLLIAAAAVLAAGGVFLRTMLMHGDGDASGEVRSPIRKAGPVAGLAVLAAMSIAIGVRPGLVLDRAHPTLVVLLGLPDEPVDETGFGASPRASSEIGLSD